MFVIEPMPITDTEFVSSNVPENDYAEWASGTTYAEGDKVIVTGTTHRIYESLAGSNTGNDPTTDDGTWWLDLGATERWRAFDAIVGNKVVNATSITYSIEPSRLCTGAAFFGLNAASVQVEVYDGTPSLIYDETKDLVDTSVVTDWFTFFFAGVEYDTEAIFTDLGAYVGCQIDITITGTTAEVGEIVVGEVFQLGTATSGTSVGVIDYSSVETDDFGNRTIVERAWADEATFQFYLPSSDARRVKRVLSRLRATAAVYFVSASRLDLGATVYGLRQDFDIPLDAGGHSFASLTVEGLV